MPSPWFAVVLAGCLPLAGCTRAKPVSPDERVARSGGELLARRGAFERRVLLSGEVDAASAVELKVPRISAGRVTVRWLENDGVAVKAGQKVAELDNAMFVSQLKERSLAVSQAEIELKRQEWQNGLDETDRSLEVERKRAVLRRAEVDADVPPGILPKRDYLEKQLALRRAQAELEKVEQALASTQRTAALDLRLKRLALEKAQRELKAAEDMAEALTLRAPADGTIIVGDHWEGRKLQIADDVFVGQTVVRMPDLHQIRIRAWLSDVDDGRIVPGMPAEVVLDAYPERVLAGEVREIAPVAREITDRSLRRVFQVVVALERPQGSDLRPGMSARVEVVAERRPDVVLVPRVALAVDEPGPAVRLASGDLTRVTLGPCNPQDCVALAGIEAGAPLRRAAP